MTAYADSNFFPRLYLQTEWTERSLDSLDRLMSTGERLPVLWLHRVEVRNAFQLYVFVGKQGSGVRVTPEAAAAAQARFRADYSSKTGPFVESGIDAALWEREMEELSLRHSAKFGFRTYDILHVAAAKTLGCDSFFTYDEKCSRLAALEGLRMGIRTG